MNIAQLVTRVARPTLSIETLLSVMGRKETAFTQLQFMAQSDPAPQIGIMLWLGTQLLPAAQNGM